ncbi:hypothetical protein D9M69_618990 [compost metagenome]
MLRGHRHARCGVFLHVQLHFVAGYTAFFLCVQRVVAPDRLDVAVFITNTGADELVGRVDFFRQLEGPVLRRAFLSVVDADFDAVIRVLAIGGECAGLDLVADQQLGRGGNTAYGRPATR